MNVLFIDNFDSFTFNLVDELRQSGARVEVWRNDLTADAALELALALPAPRLVVLSPGPGAPSEAGCCVELVQRAAGLVPVFGVCLGHQAIVEAFGGTVGPAGSILHGKASSVEHGGTGLFEGLPSPLRAGRYHSLCATRVPPELEVTAHCGPEAQGRGAGAAPPHPIVMAVEHRRWPVWGVQFHPESILTPQGSALLERVLERACAFRPPQIQEVRCA